MFINPTDYVDAGSMESCTEYGNCGIKMQVALGRTLTAADKAALNNCMDDLYAALMRETIRLSPKAKENAELQRTELLSCFSEPIYVEEIRNGYCNAWCCAHLPWFLVTTRIGHIKIGWRKRVIAIDWSLTRVTVLADVLFHNEDVTKDERTIHAWSVVKAREYVDRLLEVAI